MLLLLDGRSAERKDDMLERVGWRGVDCVSLLRDERPAVLPPLIVFLRMGGGDIGPSFVISACAVCLAAPFALSSLATALPDMAPSESIRFRRSTTSDSAPCPCELDATERIDCSSGDLGRVAARLSRPLDPLVLASSRILGSNPSIPRPRGETLLLYRGKAALSWRPDELGEGGTLPKACERRARELAAASSSNDWPGKGNADEYGNALALFWLALVGDEVGSCSYEVLDDESDERSAVSSASCCAWWLARLPFFLKSVSSLGVSGGPYALPPSRSSHRWGVCVDEAKAGDGGC